MIECDGVVRAGRTACAAALLFLLAFAQPVLAVDHEPLDPLSPEAELASFKLLPGFKANLFAAEPMLVNPIHMTWDPDGRLWVVTSTAYPQVTPGKAPDDQIVVLEDTDGDGAADKSTVFARGLYVPTGLELGDGGVYVANAPDLLFLKDNDGDGVADERRVVLSGFGTEDNHHSISAWRWGPGGWLYFQDGTFLHTQVETPYGVTRLENGGVFEFRPRDLQLRVFADYRASNPWGHMIDRWGQSILIDNPQLYFLAPLTANSRAKLAYESLYRAGTKHCGGDFVSGRHLPEEFRGEIWTNQYKTHTIERYRLVDNGSGYLVKTLEPVLTSDSEYFRPVDLKPGPDGAVYIADWFNLLIGHMQYEFRDPRRDTEHGRIWRITYEGRDLVERPKLAKAKLPDVIEHLKDPEDWTRYQVKRVLYDRDPHAVREALGRWLASLDRDDPQFDHHRLEALWCYQTIDVVEPALLEQVLSCPTPEARAAAVRVLRYWHHQIDNPLDLLATAVADEHPRVRLEAVLTLSYAEDSQSVVIALRALDEPLDRFIEHALKLTVDGLAPQWLPALRSGELAFDNARHRDWALSQVDTLEAVEPLLVMLSSGGIDEQLLEAVLPTIARQAGAKQLDPLWYRLTGSLRGGLPPRIAAQLLDVLTTAARQRRVRPSDKLEEVSRYMSESNPTIVRAAAIRLAGAWRQEQLTRQITMLARAESEPSPVRRAAVEALASLRERRELEAMAEAEQPMSTRYFAIAGLAELDVPAAAGLAAGVLSVEPADAEPRVLAESLLGRRGGAEALAAALATQPPHPQAAQPLVDYLYDTGLPHPELLDLLRGVLPQHALEQELEAEDVQQLVRDALSHGDPVRGEAIFRRERNSCTKCHAISAAGPDIGPELTSVGSSSPPDFIIDALLRPSKAIKDQYQTSTVITTDGLVYNGIVTLEDERQVVLKDAAQQGREITLPADRVEAVLPSQTSLMPEGLMNNLRDRQEFLDLVHLLTLMGKPGEYAVNTASIIRRWRVAEVSREEARSLDEALLNNENRWRAVYSRIDGTLPAADFATSAPGRVALVRGDVDLSADGLIGIELNSAAGIETLYTGSAREQVNSAQFAVSMDAGRQPLVFIINPTERGDEGLHVQLQETPGSAAQFQIVGGQ